MELLIISIAASVLGVLAVGLWAGLRARRPNPALRRSDLYGPLPEREAEQAEPPGSGQVTPGAVTPAWAGTPEAYREATGVGAGGPRHISGPPPTAHVADATRRGRDDGADWTEDDGRRGPGVLPFVALAGAAVGLAIFLVLRRRARRRTRIQRLKSGARAMVATTKVVVTHAAGSAAAIPSRIDRRATAGGGVALTIGVAALAALNRARAEGRRQAELRRRAAEALAAKGNGWHRGERARAWLAAMTRHVPIGSLPELRK